MAKIDRIDALVPHREESNDIGELTRVVNTMLQFLDRLNTEKKWPNS